MNKAWTDMWRMILSNFTIRHAYVDECLNMTLHTAQGLLSGGGGAKGTSPANALEALTEDRSVLLVDIRSQADVKEEGSPALNRVAGKSISLPFTNVRPHQPVWQCCRVCPRSRWKFSRGQSTSPRAWAGCTPCLCQCFSRLVSAHSSAPLCCSCLLQEHHIVTLPHLTAQGWCCRWARPARWSRWRAGRCGWRRP